MKNLLIILLFLATQLAAQKASHQALVWRGFQHQWTYNHRINRLGSFVQYQNQQGQTTHASASGLGADSTRFANAYTLVSSPDLLFQEGIAEVELVGKEKKLLSKRFTISVPAAEGLANTPNLTLLLNGFDIQATDGADKLKMLHIEAAQVEYTQANNHLLLHFYIDFAADCETIECAMFHQHAKYKFKIYYLVIGSQYHQLHTTYLPLSRPSQWTKKQEQPLEPSRHTLFGKKDSSLQQAFLGIRSFGIHLDRAHWTAQYHTLATPLNYQPQQGQLDILLDLAFREWRFGMKRYSAYRKHSRFSKPKAGWAIQNAQIALIQVSSADIQHLQNEGSMFWQGRNASPDNPNAINTQLTPNPAAKPQ